VASIKPRAVAIAESAAVVIIPVIGQSVSINWILERRLVNKVMSCSGPAFNVEKVDGTGACNSGRWPGPVGG